MPGRRGQSCDMPFVIAALWRDRVNTGAGRPAVRPRRHTPDIGLKQVCDSRHGGCHRFDDTRICDVINLSYSVIRLRLIPRGNPNLERT